MSIFKTDSFRLAVPDGWKAFKVNDRIIQICKGGEKDSDILSKPYVQINFSSDTYMIPPSKAGYYDITDFPPQTIGKYTWQGFECESMGFRVAMIWTGEGKRQFQLSANLETPLGKIKMTDADVLGILSSVAPIDSNMQMGVIPPHIIKDFRAAMGMATVDMAGAAPKDKNGCKMCGAAFASPTARFCHNCGAEREKQ